MCQRQRAWVYQYFARLTFQQEDYAGEGVGTRGARFIILVGLDIENAGAIQAYLKIA